MSEMVDKIYCCDRGSNDILAAAMLGKKDTDPMALMAAMNGGANNWMNNPWMYLIFLALFGGNGLGFGNRGLQGAEIQGQIDALRNQVADNHNSDLLMSAIKGNDNAISTLAASLNCDFNQLQGGICAVRSAIEQVGGQVGFSAERVINAVNMGDCNVIQAIKDCCCNTQQNIIRMGYENQLGQKDIEYKIQTGLDFVNRSVERGFSGIGFQMQQDKCDIVRAGQDNTQRIIDTLNCHWQSDLQQRYNDARLELSQQKQNAELIAALKPAATTA
nr:MAG TPA: hypothetical protein [Caudoviricetes sp.]